MGTISSKNALDNTYLNLLPLDLKCSLISYINDARILLWLLSITKWQSSVHDCTRELKYEHHFLEIRDADLTVANALDFKSLQICEIPIITDTLQDLDNLATHPRLKEFLVTIPREFVSIDTKDFFNILDKIVNFFNILINRRGSILDMKIAIDQEFESNTQNIAPFFIHDLKWSWIWQISDVISNIRQEDITSIMRRLKAKTELLYMNGMFVIQPNYITNIMYNNLLTLLAGTDNLHTLIFSADVPQELANNFILLINLPNIRKIYMENVYNTITQIAFNTFITNNDIAVFKFTPNIIYNVTRPFVYLQYVVAADQSQTFPHILGLRPFAARPGPIKLIYPLDKSIVMTLLQFIPNIRTIGFYDDFEKYQDFINFIGSLLQRINKIHIFTVKDRKTYNALKARYGRRIVIKT